MTFIKITSGILAYAISPFVVSSYINILGKSIKRKQLQYDGPIFVEKENGVWQKTTTQGDNPGIEFDRQIIEARDLPYCALHPITGAYSIYLCIIGTKNYLKYLIFRH